MLQRLLHHTDQLLKGLLILIVSTMVLNVLWQVATRFLLGSPSSWTEELARFLLIWLGLFGGSYAYRTHAHIGIDILTRKLRGTSQAIVTNLALVVVVLFALVVMVYGGSQLVLLTLALKQTSASLGIPVGYVYLALPVSGLMIAIYSLAQLFQPKLRAE